MGADAQTRRRPLARWQEIFWMKYLAPALVLVALLALLAASLALQVQLSPGSLPLGVAACLLLAGYLAWALGRPLLWASDLRRGERRARGEVLRREQRHHFVPLSETNPNQYSWHIIVRFDTQNGAPFELDAEVDPKLYRKLPEGKSVDVRHAISDPRIALFEGE